MAELKITISPDLLTLPERLRAGLKEGQYQAAEAILGYSQDQLRKVGAFATGELHDSGDIREGKGPSLRVHFDTPASLIENGRPPGPVPKWSVFEPLLRRWAEAKGLKIDNLYPIALKIRREGYPGRAPFRTVLEQRKAEIDDALQAPVRQAINGR